MEEMTSNTTIGLYHYFDRCYPNSQEFKDMERDSGMIRDLTEDLENKNIPYVVYDNKVNRGCTVFYGKI